MDVVKYQCPLCKMVDIKAGNGSIAISCHHRETTGHASLDSAITAWKKVMIGNAVELPNGREVTIGEYHFEYLGYVAFPYAPSITMIVDMDDLVKKGCTFVAGALNSKLIEVLPAPIFEDGEPVDILTGVRVMRNGKREMGIGYCETLGKYYVCEPPSGTPRAWFGSSLCEVVMSGSTPYVVTLDGYAECLSQDVFGGQPEEVDFACVDYDRSLHFGKATNPRTTWASGSYRGYKQIGPTINNSDYYPETSIRRINAQV